MIYLSFCNTCIDHTDALKSKITYLLNLRRRCVLFSQSDTSLRNKQACCYNAVIHHAVSEGKWQVNRKCLNVAIWITGQY